MHEIKVGDFIVVKDGIFDLAVESVCIAGWSGKVTKIEKGWGSDNPSYFVDWDLRTIKSFPKEFIEEGRKVELNYSFCLFSLEEIEKLDKPTIMEGRNIFLDMLKEPICWN